WLNDPEGTARDRVDARALPPARADAAVLIGRWLDCVTGGCCARRAPARNSLRTGPLNDQTRRHQSSQLTCELLKHGFFRRTPVATRRMAPSLRDAQVDQLETETYELMKLYDRLLLKWTRSPPKRAIGAAGEARRLYYLRGRVSYLLHV